MIDGYRISTDLQDMDLTVVHDFIAHSYWAAGIPIKTLRRAMENSLCFGIFTDSGSQVAFARTATDLATFAYLADVFVLEEHRGRGLGKWLMRFILAHPDLQGLRRILLATRDAHSLYREFGFESLDNADIFMQRWDPEVYSDNNQRDTDK